MQSVGFNIATLKIANCGGQHPYNEPDAVRLFGEMVEGQCKNPGPCSICQKRVTAYFPAAQVQEVAGPFFDKYPFESCHLTGKAFDFSKENGGFKLSLIPDQLKVFWSSQSVHGTTPEEDSNYLRERGVAIKSVYLQGLVVGEEGRKEVHVIFLIAFSSDESKNQFHLFLLEHGFTIGRSSKILEIEVRGSDFFKLLKIVVENNTFDDFASLYIRQLKEMTGQ